MKNAYQHCTRCGDELPDWLKEKYTEEHQRGPVLCTDCVGEIISGIGEAMKPVMDAYQSLISNALGSLADAYTEDN